MNKVKILMIGGMCVLGLASVKSSVATVTLSAADCTYKYDAWDDKSYIDSDAHTASNAFATDFSNNHSPGWQIYKENPGSSGERDYVASDGYVPYNSYENRWEIQFALPGEVQSVTLTYYWLIDNTAPDKHAIGIGYYDKAENMVSLDQSYDGKSATKEIPIADIQGLTSIKVFGYLMTTDSGQAGSYTTTKYQFFRTGSQMGNPFKVHITSVPEPATIGLLVLGFGFLRRR